MILHNLKIIILHLIMIQGSSLIILNINPGNIILTDPNSSYINKVKLISNFLFRLKNPWFFLILIRFRNYQIQ